MSRFLYIAIVIIANIVADQWSKFWVRANVEKSSQSSIIGDYLTLHNVENTGAFLGLGSDLNPTLKLILLLILPIVVLGIVGYQIIKDKTMNCGSLTGFCFVIGGGIANIYDRIVYQSVTDFLHIDLGGVFRTGIFNLADVSVMIGMGFLLCFGGIFNKKTAK